MEKAARTELILVIVPVLMAFGCKTISGTKHAMTTSELSVPVPETPPDVSLGDESAESLLLTSAIEALFEVDLSDAGAVAASLGATWSELSPDDIAKGVSNRSTSSSISAIESIEMWKGAFIKADVPRPAGIKLRLSAQSCYEGTGLLVKYSEGGHGTPYQVNDGDTPGIVARVRFSHQDKSFFLAFTKNASDQFCVAEISARQPRAS
jgi:hypothetical protein